ncbi:MAG TPA: protein kinase [Archangium sp.]|uniref:protein kinase domain-containing protein n=1 Tax=Archangium sp. TaxID=1872627 RepID=UPI002E359305|nr:protein kinase [Archangium sp.]HEX5754075.1 protein kinase [Archangium sp.]
MSQVRYQSLGPLMPGEGSRPFLALALEEGAAPRPVVLVWAPAEVAQDAMQRARLERETERAVVFEHPNILRVHGLVTLEGRLARVTEYADGEPLRQVLDAAQRLPPPLAALVAADVAMGVHYAHVAGNDDGTPLIHGDLRPETVMVSFNGVCKVSGYGALGVAPRERNGRRVRNRRLYIAPEQLLGGREASSVLTDVFLLGLLLYECLSGRKPFQDSIEPDKAILNRPLPPLPPEIPLPYNEVVRRATAKRSGDRYPSALAFREALVAVSGELPPSTAFAELISKLIPPDNELRAARKRTIDKGLEALARGAVAPARLTGPVPVVAPEPVSARTQIPITGSAPIIAPEPISVRAQLPITGSAPILAPEPVSVRTQLPTAVPPEEPAPSVPPASLAPPAVAEPPAVPAPPPAETRPARARRSSTPLAVAVGAVLLVSAVGTVWSVRQKPPPVEDLGTDAGEELRFDTPVLLEAAPASPTDAGVRVAAAPAAPTVPPTPVEIFVSPGDVSVSVDGKAMGRSPLTVPLAPGRHMLNFLDEARGLRTARMIDVRSTPDTVTFRIRLGMGSILVHAPSGAKVTLDGQDLGTAPVSEKTLFEGEHQLRVTQNESVWEKTFMLPGDQRLVFNVDFEAEE